MSGPSGPADKDRSYFGWIAALPCVACWSISGRINHEVQVAHLRAGSLAHDKLATGMQQKSENRFVTPLCAPHHVGDVRKARVTQHAKNELLFWTEDVGINPFSFCIALNDAHDKGAPGAMVIAKFVAEARRVRAAGR